METKEQNTNPLLEGVIWKQLLIFFFPILLGSFFQQLYNTIDSLIVGNYVGTQALAAVGGSSSQIVFLVVGFFTGLSSGCGVIISQHYGAKNHEKVSEAIHTSYMFSILGGVVLSVIALFCVPTILRIMNQPEDIMASSVLYLRIYFSGLIFVFVYNIGSAIIRALGNSKLPLYILIICSVVNVILDLVLVVAMNLGVLGVAVATLLSQMVSACLVTGALIKGVNGCTLSLSQLRISLSCLKRLLQIGVPGGVQSVMYSVANMTAQAGVNIYGSADIKIESLFWMTTNAFGLAITTFIGQNYGAGKTERVKKSIITCFWIEWIICISLSVVFKVFADSLIGIFTRDQEAVHVGVMLLATVAPYYILFSAVEVFTGVLRGIGDVFIPTIMVLLSMCLFRIGWLMIIVPRFPAIMSIVIMYPISWGIGGACFVVYYLVRGRKLISQKQMNM